MEETVAYINIKNLTRLNNCMMYALENPDRDLNLKFLKNTAGLEVIEYHTYREYMKNTGHILNELQNSRYYKTFEDAYRTFKEAYIGKKVTGNFYLLSNIGEIASRLSCMCYRADEIGYEKPDSFLIRAAGELRENKAAGKEFSIVEQIYIEIIDKIRNDLKEIKPEHLPDDLRFYYELALNEFKGFKVSGL